MLKQRLKELLKELTSICGVSGREQQVIAALAAKLRPLADEMSVDNWGNIVAVKHGGQAGPKVMIGAHADEIGLCVKSVLPNGFILMSRLGGVNDILLQGRRVRIKGAIPGILGIKAGHLMNAEERSRIKPMNDCYIDVGAFSKEEVLAMGIRIGDRISFEGDFMEMHNPDLICSKAVDDRIGCSAVVALFEELQGKSFPGTLCGVITVQEEIGLRGAAMISGKVAPDYAIALDTIPSGDTPDVSYERQLPIRLGGGPAIALLDGIDSAFVSNIVHPKVQQILEEAAERAGAPLQMVTLGGETYTTDAANISLEGGGIPIGVLLTPRRYSHSPVELLNINDAVCVVNILREVVLKNGSVSLNFIE
jgi:endoglucanase